MQPRLPLISILHQTNKEELPMNVKQCQSTIIKSALFVDFDNVFMSLLKVDPGAAVNFAANPERWLRWIEAGLPTDTNGAHVAQQRAVLIRRCYLNLSARYPKICKDFTNSGFSVIACPILTHHSKNSADIHMIIDILDTLQHHMHIDEFIVMSGDSDFTPVLLRLRAYDRRTTIISANGATNAYRAASDRTISGDTFMTHAIGRSSKNLLDEMAKRVYTVVSEKGAIPISHLPSLFQEFEQYRDLSYIYCLGFETLRGLTLELARRHEGLFLVEGQDGQSWKVALKLPVPPAKNIKAVPARPEPAQPSRPAEPQAETSQTAPRAPERLLAVQTPEPQPEPSSDSTSPSPAEVPSNRELQAKIIAAVGRILSQSSEPVFLAWLAKEIRKIFGAQIDETEWAGVGRFKKLLQMARRPGIVVEIAPDLREYVYDPKRHTLPQANSQKEQLEKPQQAFATHTNDQIDVPLHNEPSDQIIPSTAVPGIITSQPVVSAPVSLNVLVEHILQAHRAGNEQISGVNGDMIEALIRKVHTATRAPLLTCGQYAIMFQAISDTAQERPYPSETAVMEIQKRCLKQNVPIVQAQLSLILKGLEYAGHTLGVCPTDDTPFRLAIAFRDVVVRLCRAQRLELSADERRLIDDWLGEAMARK
jgi:hypothetical protein